MCFVSVEAHSGGNVRYLAVDAGFEEAHLEDIFKQFAVMPFAGAYHRSEDGHHLPSVGVLDKRLYLLVRMADHKLACG